MALFTAFWLWQVVRLFFPGLEVHPVFMYIYSIIEIRDSSEKTVNFGKRRIKATFTALAVGLPLLALTLYLKALIAQPWMATAIELGIMLFGVLVAISIAEIIGCQNLCGLAGTIFVVLFISHGDDMPYVYAILRAFQTIAGVFVAWIFNVKLFPYPGKQADPPQK